MDKLLNLGKQAYEQYNESQQQGGQHGQQGGHGGNAQQGGYGGQQGSYGGQQGGYGGGQDYGSQQQGRYDYSADPANQPGAGHGFNAGGGSQYNDNSFQSNQSAQGIDLEAAARHAQKESDSDGSLFTQALGFLQQKKTDGDVDIDEDEVQRAHSQAYQQGNASNLSSNAIGGAAAMQALKMFTSGGASGQSSSSGGGSSAMIGMAMKEAAKLFDQSGGAASGNKQDAVNSAGSTMLKLLLNGMIGGGQSGGLSGLMGMAQQFMK